MQSSETDLLGGVKNGVVFHNPTLGDCGFDSMVSEIAAFMNEDRLHKYSLAVGTDSEQRNGIAEFVSVVVVHRIGKFGRYFWKRQKAITTPNLRDRMYKEAEFSLVLAEELIGKIKEQVDNNRFGFEIHIDVGENGPTKDMIKEVVGMVKGNGFEARIKPDAYGATKVADKHV